MIKKSFRAALGPWLLICAIALIWGGVFAPRVTGFSSCLPCNLNHFDAQLEVWILKYGYIGLTPAKLPMFSTLGRVVAVVMGPDLALAIISKAVLLPALMALWLFVNQFADETLANRALLYFLFPLTLSGYTWIVTYPETLDLLILSTSFIFFFEKRYILVGAILSAGVLTRPQTVLLIPIFGASLSLFALRESGATTERLERWLRRVLLVCAIPALVHVLWIWKISAATNIPLANYTLQQNFGRFHLIWPWKRLATRIDRILGEPQTAQWGIILEAVQASLLAFEMAILTWLLRKRRIGWEIYTYSMATVFIASLTALYALSRFSLISLLPLAPAMILPKRWDRVLISLLVILNIAVLVGLTLNPFTP